MATPFLEPFMRSAVLGVSAGLIFELGPFALKVRHFSSFHAWA